jgi:plasmid stabilization system protein ParE
VSSYVLGTDAALDLEDIWEYIARDNIDTAERWIEKLFVAFDSLAELPSLGHTRRDLTQYLVRFWPVGAYFIIYRTTRSIEIVAVTQGFRDIPAFLQRRMP